MDALKSPIVLCSLLLIALTCRTQLLWEHTWGGPYDDGCEVRNTADGGMIAMGTFAGSDSWIMRMDQNGDTLWTRRITQPFDLCAITETTDGGFLATGITRTAHRDLMAWKFDLRGDSLWLKVYADSLNTEGMYSVLAEPDSSFLISGYTSAHGYDMLAIHIDSVGNEIWKRTYGGPGFEGGTTSSPTDDGGYVFATTGGTNSFSNIWVVRVDGLGDTVWTKNIVEAHQTGGPIPTVLTNGNIVVIGWIEVAGDYDNYAFCLDAMGNLLWSRRYLGTGFESRTARGVLEDRFGGLTFASSIDLAYGPNGNDQDIALFRVDTLGNVLQIHRIGRQGDEMPRYFEQAADGDYLFFGYSTSFIAFGQQTYLSRLHPGGCGEFFYDLPGANHLTVCPGDSVLADAGAGFSHYLWSDGDTNQIRLVTQDDTLYCETVDASGCRNYSSSIVVDVKRGPEFTWTASSLAVQFDGNLGDGNAPHWDFGDGSIANVTDTVHVFAQAGTYYTCLQSFVLGCGYESFCDSVTVIGTTAALLPSLATPSLSPNPGNGHFLLHNPTDAPVIFHISSLQAVSEFQIEIPANTGQALDLSAWPSAVYLLQMKSGDINYPPRRVVIVR